MDMRISGVYQAYSTQSSRGAQLNRGGSERSRMDSDRVSISSQAGDYQVARRALTQAPDIRQEEVLRVQNMLDAGVYRVSAQDVAASIFRELA